MTGYAKLFQSILDSTIWQEPAHVRLTWITMLAMADKNSIVGASIPGLARRAGVTTPECEDALERLQSPDPYSRTKDHEGRRIKTIDGGWFLYNYGKYRDLISLTDKRARDADRARRYRARQRDASQSKRDASRDITPFISNSNFISNSKTSLTSKQDPSKSKDQRSKKREKKKYSDEFEMFWGAGLPKVSKQYAWSCWQKATNRPSVENCIEKIRALVAHKKNCDKTGKWCPELPHPATWLNRGRWEDEISTPTLAGWDAPDPD